MNLGNVRAGLATQLQQITNLRTYDYIPDSINTPCAVVEFPETWSFDSAFQRGLDATTITVLLLVGKASDRNAQTELETFITATGARSIKTIIEQDKTLSGAASTLRVTKADQFGTFTIGANTYLGARFHIEVYG